ncbi:MAG: iron chelate uptake ABC transporter family permease subunit [Firmicutes bacterium]|nr:iron chelate uptake ABC transporter family permease subunit [Bacillota bacterium]
MILSVLALLLALSIVAATGTGAVTIPPGEVAGAILGGLDGLRLPVGGLVPRAVASLVEDVPATHRTIILSVRLPRVVLAALVGMSLAVAGTTFQGLFKNPMADPYVIGVSSGAALGACVAILTSLDLNFLGVGAVPAFAFVGALAAVAVVYRLACRGNRVPVTTLLLSGIAVGSFLSAIVSLLVFFSGQQLHQVTFWLMGGFSARGWDYVKICLPYMAVGSIVISIFARDLNALVLGEEPAQHLGVDVERVKGILLLTASLLTAAAVSVSGLIGFVGLIVPHICRIIAGPDHRTLLPAAALMGALFLVGSDTLARVVVAPNELPVGIVTALFGGPFFIYLLHRKGGL